MALVQPFRAFRYSPALAPFDKVLTQPYDKISPAMQEKYYAADPHNLIAVEKGRILKEETPENNVYSRAAASLNSWIAEHVIQQDPAPAFYAMPRNMLCPALRFAAPAAASSGLANSQDYSDGVIFRHEHTLSGPKADRLELLRHTRTHTGQLFMIYS